MSCSPLGKDHIFKIAHNMCMSLEWVVLPFKPHAPQSGQWPKLDHHARVVHYKMVFRDEVFSRIEFFEQPMMVYDELF